ncbi:MAG TPA: fatty acid desaturase [Patescibacteria group bacterium]|nr:fatty acid desaturase [Patescibacteria group bacterium]
MDHSYRAEETSLHNTEEGAAAAPQPDYKRMVAHCNAYKGSQLGSAIWQLINTSVCFFGSLAAMFVAERYGYYWLAALIMVPAAGLLIRMFIIQHDCGHGSFFANKLANDITGRIISVFTFTPYDLWKRVHNMHHAGSGNLDRRGSGSVDTLTVEEYKALTPFKKFSYRVYRHPLTLLVFGPPVYVLIFQRFPPAQKFMFIEKYHSVPREQCWKSVMSLNLAILAVYAVAGALLGWGEVAVLYLGTLILAFWAGQWLFFVQHQFEDGHWKDGHSWSYAQAAVEGSSYYALPKILQWFTGNIGFHHIHHLNASIPNYRLEECHHASEDFTKVPKLTLKESLKCATLALWDEQKGKMVRFKDVKA